MHHVLHPRVWSTGEAYEKGMPAMMNLNITGAPVLLILAPAITTNFDTINCKSIIR
ncbi:hypothetical protein J2785_000026 [Burkholderia ambifaria]|nr:hypothetical protein [Burkholderia ambifaria]MDR6496884.1 hypothetical protein [Burkholderia ambifaria]